MAPEAPLAAQSDADEDRRSNADRRQGGRGGRRRGDTRRPWWQKGLVFAALCAVVRCWRYIWPSDRSRVA